MRFGSKTYICHLFALLVDLVVRVDSYLRGFAKPQQFEKRFANYAFVLAVKHLWHPSRRDELRNFRDVQASPNLTIRCFRSWRYPKHRSLNFFFNFDAPDRTKKPKEFNLNCSFEFLI